MLLQLLWLTAAVVKGSSAGLEMISQISRVWVYSLVATDYNGHMLLPHFDHYEVGLQQTSRFWLS